MEHTHPKNNTLRHYWFFLLPLALSLTIMIRFPVRIFMRSSVYDVILYGTIALMCFGTGVWVYARFSKRAIPLMVVIVWCMVVCIWQVLDALVWQSPFAHTYFYIIRQTVSG